MQDKERHIPPPTPPKWVLFLPDIKNADYRIRTDDDNDNKNENFDENYDDGNFDENDDKMTKDHSNNINL